MCPVMTSNLKKVQHATNELDIHFLSMSIDPKNDTSAQLLRYMKNHSIEGDNWNFAHGSQDQLDAIGTDFMLAAQADDNAPGGFLHSSSLVLIDKDGFIRGIYDGLENQEVDSLILDLNKLITSYD